MSSPVKPIRATTMVAASSSLTTSVNDVQDDFQAFQMRPVIRDFKLSAELFASNGDTVLICGRSNQEKQGMLLVSYEIPSQTGTLSIRLLKVIRLAKRVITQLETVPVLKIALIVADGIVTVLDAITLAEITTVSTSNVVLFSTWYDIGSDLSQASKSVPTELRICVATRRRALFFHRWIPTTRKVEEDKKIPSPFDLIDIPRVLALSQDIICVGFKRSYMIISLLNGQTIKDLPFNMPNDPVINCLQDRTQWCIQMECNTIFLKSNFEPLYTNAITWKDIPSAIVQSKPYVLSLMSQSIDVCTFNGSESVPVQQIPLRTSSTTGKCRLWMDVSTGRIYAATATDVVLLEPIPVHIQLTNYIGRYRYDLALILLRAILGMSASSSNNEQERQNDGHAKGNIDINSLPKQYIFVDKEQRSSESISNKPITRQMSKINDLTRSDETLSESEQWIEYYRIGTMHAFQLFHRKLFEQAFTEFNEFLTDPTEIISLFSPLCDSGWLGNSYYELRTFIKQHQHFSEPPDFVGITFASALYELQRYLTDHRRIFQTIFRRDRNAWLEVQSLVQNRFLLKPIHDLLMVVETALFKAYVVDNNMTLANALLRNQDNCCQPSEVEQELKKNHRRAELVLLYEKQNRHDEALELMMRTESLSSTDQILNYLAKLNKDNLQLIFKYIEPIIRSELQNKSNNNNATIDLIRNIFTDTDSIPTSPSITEEPNTPALKHDPIEVFEFLKGIDQEFAVKYLDFISLKPALGSRRRDVHNRLVYAYCDLLKQLSEQLKPMIKERHQESYEDNDILATTSTSNVNMETNPRASAISEQRVFYQNKLKSFLINQNCQCDFDKLEAYFLQEQIDPSNERLFSLYYGIVLGKLNRHEAALETFIKNGLFKFAEKYCETIYSEGNIELAHELYHRLIQFHLKSFKNGNLDERMLNEILRIVNKASDRLDPVKTLETLPGEIKLKNMKDFIEQALQTCSAKKRNSQLERNLLFLKLLRTHSNRIASESHSFTIDVDSPCARAECRQPFTGTQAVVRFPNNKIVHLHCKTKYETECLKNNRKPY